ncbi:hypothetical protein ACWCQL_24335 [Streptomyces sp. NPDC002073]
MTVVRDSHGVTRGGGVAGWALLPAPVSDGGRPLRSADSAPAPSVPTHPHPAPAVEPVPEPEAADDLVALAASLNGLDETVYFDRRAQYAWLANA